MYMRARVYMSESARVGVVQCEIIRPSHTHLNVHAPYRLVGLVVKASASRAEGPRFKSRLRRDFLGVESYQ